MGKPHEYSQPPLPPGVPSFGQATPDQLTATIADLNLAVRYLKDEVKLRPDPYTDYLLERTNEERGGTFGEMLLYRAIHPEETPFFTATIQANEPERPPSESVVVFEITDQTRPKGRLRTTTRLGMIFFPKKISNPSQAVAYIEGATTKDEALGLAPVPNISRNTVLELAKKIELIDTIEKKADYGSATDSEKIKQFGPLKLHYLLQDLLPARRGKVLPQGTDVRVIRRRDAGGKEAKDQIDVVIEVGNKVFVTTLSVGRLKNEVYEQLLKEVGDFDIATTR